MTIPELITGGTNAPPVIHTGDGVENAVQKDGIAILRGTPSALTTCIKRVREKYPTWLVSRFATISGNLEHKGISIPVDNKRVTHAALRDLIVFKGKTRGARLKIKAVQTGNAIGRRNSLLKNQWAVIATPETETIFSFLKNITKKDDLTVALYATSRKYVLPVYKKNTGEVQGYAKVYFPGVESEQYGEHEANILKKLEGTTFTTAEPPRVKAQQYFKKCACILLSTKRGVRNHTGITRTHIKWMEELSQKTGAKKEIANSRFITQMDDEVKYIVEQIPHEKENIEAVYKNATDALKGKTLLLSLVMREFPYFQILQSREGALVIDWEHARYDFPIIFDCFSLLMSVAPHKKGEYIALYQKNITQIFFSSNPKNRAYINEIAGHMSATPEDTYHLFWLYLIDQLYIHLHAGHPESAERITNFFTNAHDKPNFSFKNWQA